MRRVGVMAAYELRMRSRDPVGLFWMLMFPLLMAGLFGSIAGAFGDATAPLRVALVGDTDAEWTTELREGLEAAEQVELVDLKQTEARRAVRVGDLSGFVEVVLGEEGSVPEVRLGLDPARKTDSVVLEGLIKSVVARSAPATGSAPDDASTDSAPNKAADSSALKPPSPPPQAKIERVDIMPEAQSPFVLAFASVVLWGMLGCAATFAISLVGERVHGTYVRLRVAPLSRWQVLAGKGLACFVAELAIVAVLLAIAALAFELRIANVWGLICGALSVAACFVGVMMFVSVLGKTENAVAGAGWAANIVMAAFGGAMIPPVAMPQWMADISFLSPVRWGIMALEGAIWRDLRIVELMPACGVLLGVGAALFAAGNMLAVRFDR